VSWGGAFAALAWLLSSVVLSLYVENIREESRTYGPLGAVIGLVTCLWPSATVILIGAALNAELEREAG
jgi:membrane protein